MSDVQLVEFVLEGQRHALPMVAVERVAPVVEVTPLPGAPAAVLGAIDVGGRILAVFSLRRHLGLPDRALRLSDAFLIARTSRRLVALLVDEMRDVLANREMRRPDDAAMGVGIFFNGQRHFITADRLQILNLLLSTYDAAIQRNRELTENKESLEKRSVEIDLANRFLDEVIENIPLMDLRQGCERSALRPGQPRLRGVVWFDEVEDDRQR